MKYLLISKIDDTDDENLLKAIYTLLNSSQNIDFTVNEPQSKSIYQEKKDMEMGNYILNEDLRAEVVSYFKK